MFCKHCGAQIEDDSVCCSACGEKIQAPDPGAGQKPSKKKIFLIAGIAAIVLIAAIAVGIGVAGSSEPIVGKWKAAVAVKDDNVVPVLTDSYISISRNGKFFLHLDDDTEYNGTWERYTGSIETDNILYELNFDGTSGKELLIFNPEKEEISVMIAKIMIVFKK